MIGVEGPRRDGKARRDDAAPGRLVSAAATASPPSSALLPSHLTAVLTLHPCLPSVPRGLHNDVRALQSFIAGLPSVPRLTSDSPRSDLSVSRDQ